MKGIRKVRLFVWYAVNEKKLQQFQNSLKILLCTFFIDKHKNGKEKKKEATKMGECVF